MEEIICPQCGRPNLIEAEKCWYCQTILEKNTVESQNKTSDIPTEANGLAEKKISQENEKLPVQDIPEWLTRIRDLKEADQPPEEKDPDWQQKDLFMPEQESEKKKLKGKKRPPPKEKTLGRDTKNKKADGQSLIIKEQKRSKQNSDADDHEKGALAKQNKNPENLSDELPEGFTKL